MAPPEPPYDDVIAKVCRDHGLTVTDAMTYPGGTQALAAKFDIPPSWLLGRSYLIGENKDQVVLGIYDEDTVEVTGPEATGAVRAAAFFHEVGHHLARAKKPLEDPLGRELEAWHLGLDLAKKYGLDLGTNHNVAMRWLLVVLV